MHQQNTDSPLTISRAQTTKEFGDHTLTRLGTVSLSVVLRNQIKDFVSDMMNHFSDVLKIFKLWINIVI
jgi:hypothetical protein